MFKTFTKFALTAAALALALAGTAKADSIVTLNYSQSNGSGPFGMVDVAQVDANTLSVTLTLTPGEVFAITGAGAGALGFSLDKSYTLVSSPALTSGFTLDTPPGPYGFASGIGNFTSVVVCTSCGSGTSAPRYSGPVSFEITNATGLSFADFLTGTGGYLFASDIGVPNPTSPGNFNTFVVGGGPVSTPEPSSILLVALGMATLFIFRRKQVLS